VEQVVGDVDVLLRFAGAADHLREAVADARSVVVCPGWSIVVGEIHLRTIAYGVSQHARAS